MKWLDRFFAKCTVIDIRNRNLLHLFLEGMYRLIKGNTIQIDSFVNLGSKYFQRYCQISYTCTSNNICDIIFRLVTVNISIDLKLIIQTVKLLTSQFFLYSKYEIFIITYYLDNTGTNYYLIYFIIPSFIHLNNYKISLKLKYLMSHSDLSCFIYAIYWSYFYLLTI